MKNIETSILDQPAKKVYTLSRIYASGSARVMVSRGIEKNVEFQTGVRVFDRIELLSFSIFSISLTIHRPASVMRIPGSSRSLI